ncbi:MAG: hypothetical protein HQL15_06950 [Candidatus Omnitrophica bacterium]|nr:hypothetical protein [Candidatus Omnitrophota bacterium]
MSKVVIFILGFLFLAVGLGIVIKNWDVLAAMVKAFSGVMMALVGLVMMFSVSLRR